MGHSPAAPDSVKGDLATEEPRKLRKNQAKCPLCDCSANGVVLVFGRVFASGARFRSERALRDNR
jgi:hypothetical protein